ncbi:NAD(P)-dependent oxidoreductase [Candidatus Woesearchaeota archaeon]|nr:NAD(P)-dependent oxidoreductase [Candidatus Woesearchaeota archaeon]
MKNKTILITGGAGFIGRNLAETLSKDNKVIILDKNKIKADIKHCNITSICADVRKKGWFSRIKKADCIFHLAATVGVDYVAAHPEETRSTEVLGMRNIIEFARKKGVRKIVYSSTSSVYEAIKSPTAYNTAKLYSEQLLRNSRLTYSIIRLFNIYGRYQKDKMVVSKFIKNALANNDIIIYSSGSQTRDFTYIDDATKAIIRVAESSKTDNRTIDIGTGQETKIIDLAKIVVKLTKSKSNIKKGKIPKQREDYEVRNRVSDPKKLKSLTGLSCSTNLRTGISKILENGD